jgi:PAS domain S-box-containing protein
MISIGFPLSLFAEPTLNLTKEEKKWIKQHPTIIFGSDSDWFPYIRSDSKGNISGIEVDLIKSINKIAGINIQLKTGRWVDILEQAKDKKIAGLAVSVAHEERKEHFIFSDELYRIYKYILSNNPQIKTMKDLEGKRVSYQKGNMLEENLVKNIKDIILVPVENDKEHVNLLKTGKVDAAVGGAALKLTSSELMGPGVSLTIPNSEVSLVYSIRKDWILLRSIINKALKEMSYKKRIEILEKWNENIQAKDIIKNLGLTQDERNWLNTHNSIKMCVLPDWLPFEQIDKNIQHNGIGADIIKLISKEINTPIVLVPTKQWSTSLKNIREKKCDILPVAMDIPSRRDAMNFTKPYWKEPFVIATKQDKFFIKDSNGIGNKKIGIVKSYAFIEVLKSRNPEIEIVEVKNAQEGLRKVQNGELFGYVDIMAAVGYNIQKYGFYDIKIAGKLEFTIDLSIASRNDEPHLSSIMQKAIDNISENEIRTIVGKWIEIKVQQDFDYTKLFYVIFVFSIIVLVVMYKNRSIKSINEELENAYDKLNEQKKIAESLTQYQKTLLALFDKSDAVLFKFKLDENLILDVEYVSMSIERLIGYKSADLMSKKVSYISTIHKDDIQIVQNNLYENLKNKVEYFKHEPYRIITKTGEIKYVLDYTVALKDENDKTTHVLAYITDITDYIRQQNMLLQQSKMASLGEMIGNISHQWRQPLSIISTGATGMQLQKEYGLLTDEMFIDTCNTINKNAQYLSKTIDDFKNFIKGERTLVEFNIYETIEQVLSLVESSTRNNYIDIVLDCEKDIFIKGYPNEFIQSIINIYNNSKDVLINLPEGERFFFITLKKHKESVILELKDNGGGVDEKILANIFEPYITIKHKSMGTGLGLNITYNFIVTGMHGTISVENESYVYNDKEYKGAKFKIMLSI